MKKEHHYKTVVRWTGNLGEGTSSYKNYSRDHIISIVGKPDILGSSDPSFRGDNTRQNPEELLLASLSACHMLWYLHFCAEAGVVVTDYSDNATGTMIESSSGSGRFSEVTLHPVVVVSAPEMIERANLLHKNANESCFIANSCNFPVLHQPVCKTATSYPG